MSELPPTCEVCGAPATNWARDFYRRENLQTGWYESEPIPMFHSGCDKHQAESHTFDVSPLLDYPS